MYKTFDWYVLNVFVETQTSHTVGVPFSGLWNAFILKTYMADQKLLLVGYSIINKQEIYSSVEIVLKKHSKKRSYFRHTSKDNGFLHTTNNQRADVSVGVDTYFYPTFMSICLSVPGSRQFLKYRACSQTRSCERQCDYIWTLFLEFSYYSTITGIVCNFEREALNLVTVYALIISFMKVSI